MKEVAVIDMTKEEEDLVRAIADAFAIGGDFREAEVIEGGLINPTYRVVFNEGEEERRYILQRINEVVFPRPLEVIKNVELVTRHINEKVLRVKKDMGGQTLSLYPSRTGEAFVEGEQGGIWRCYNFIEGCRTYDVVENTRQAYQAGHAFGAFQDLVSDLEAEAVTETIEGFHDTRERYGQLMAAVESDAYGRVSSVEEELRFLKERESATGRLLDLQSAGEMPLRITHNDTKINNVMIDEETDEAVCVIDLDTVMPGLALYDFGDLVRTATSPVAEDERDLTRVKMRMPFFEALVEGYLEAAGGFLNESEKRHLVFSGKLLTLEVAIRFLTDYLQGDEYFKTCYAEHNLDRCRNQIALIKSMEAQEKVMERFVARLCE